jgi:hypothetical protein
LGTVLLIANAILKIASLGKGLPMAAII